jgi:hypothetical protein
MNTMISPWPGDVYGGAKPGAEPDRARRALRGSDSPVSRRTFTVCLMTATELLAGAF